MDLLKQCQKWHEDEEHLKIVEAISKISPEDRTLEINLELARAYNNIADTDNYEGRGFLKKALDILLEYEDELVDDYSWNFRTGYAYYYLNQECYALKYLRKALEKHPGDNPQINAREEIEFMVDNCIRNLSLPLFDMTFRERTKKAWNIFLQEEENLRNIMDQNHKSSTDELREEIVKKSREILSIAFNDVSFELGFNGQKYELILTPENSKAKLFELVYFEHQTPKSLLENWNILVGRKPSNQLAIESFGYMISGDDIQVWVDYNEEDFDLTLYCDKLSNLPSEEDYIRNWFLYTLTEQALGDIAAMKYINSIDIVNVPKSESYFKLSELTANIDCNKFNINITPEEYLENYTGYECEPDQDPDANLRMDIIVGVNNCPTILNNYLDSEYNYVDGLYADGTVAGFIYYPLIDFDGENRTQEIFDFRDSLEESLLTNSGDEAVSLLGGATGLYYGYVDFIAYDINTVLQAARDFFEKSDISWASFHTFRRDTYPVQIYDANNNFEKDGKKYLDTNSILSPRDIENLESFESDSGAYFGKMIDYLDEFISNGVAREEFTKDEAYQDLTVSLRYAYAYLNLNTYEGYYYAAKMLSYSSENAKGSGTWYYRYSVALTYLGQLEEAFKYAEQGAIEEPDYPWIWLQVAKLRAYFGNKDAALEAVEKGFSIVPNDYEFTVLKNEIINGATIEEMEYHWINPSYDLKLQNGIDKNASEKLKTIYCITLDKENLAKIYELFDISNKHYRKNNPFCEFDCTVENHNVNILFPMNEAGLSKLDCDWLKTQYDYLNSGKWTDFKDRYNEEYTLEKVILDFNQEVQLIYKSKTEDENILKTQPDEFGNPIVSDSTGHFFGAVLLSDESWDKEKLINDLKDNWYIDAVEKDSDKNDNSLVFEVDNILVAVNFVPTPIPENEAEIKAGFNYMWKDGVEVAKAHKSHMFVVLWGENNDLLQKGEIHTKVISACCNQTNATGVYTGGVVMEPNVYKEYAEVMKEGWLPIYNWIWFGLYQNENGLSGYTFGLEIFGKNEIEIINTSADYIELLDFMSGIVNYILEYDITLKDGETIGLSSIDKNKISFSDGVCLPGMTFKIDYRNENSNIICMDDGQNHIKAINEKELQLDNINVYNHMAIYLQWCIKNNLMSNEFKDTYKEVLCTYPANDLRLFICNELNGKLLSNIFNIEGMSFAKYYYGNMQSPYYPSDIDDYALKYFGAERYYSEEFEDEAYLYIPFNEKYCNDISDIITRRWQNWLGQEIEDSEPSELADVLMKYLDVPCRYFPPMKDDDPIASAYSYKKRMGVKEGYIPMLIKVDEILWECLILNSDPKNDGSDDFYFDLEKVEKYRSEILSKSFKNSSELLKNYIDLRKEEAIDDELDWSKDIIGSMENGTELNRFMSYWNSETNMTYPMILAEIPVSNPWEVFAWLPFGNWNECPDTLELMSVAKYWYEKYDSIPAVLTHDELEFILPKPLAVEDALTVATEQYGFCPDMDQNFEKIGMLADTLTKSTVWYFWWD